MAANDSSRAMPSAILGKSPVAFHQHDNWLVPTANKDANAQFASVVLDVARGARVIASILCNHLVDLQALSDGGDTRPLLTNGDTEALARLAVVSLDQLYKLSEERVEDLNAKAAKESKA